MKVAGVIVEDAGVIVEGNIVFGARLVAVQVNRELVMAGKVEFGLSNKVEIGAKRILALLLHQLTLVVVHRVGFVSNKVVFLDNTIIASLCHFST